MKVTLIRTGVLGLIVLWGAAESAQAQWGTLEGQFVLSGDRPTVPPLVRQGDATVKDATVCAAQEVPDDSRMFDAETGGVANVFIYLRSAPGQIHPELAQSSEPEVTFDQKNCRFLPHAMVVRTDQTIRLISSDSVAHNVHTYPFRNQSFNSILQANDQTGLPLQMPQPEALPVKVGCDIHPWMVAYWVVLDHPYAAVSDEQGRFRIENLPAGTHSFRIWHERVGYVERDFSVEITSGGTNTLDPISIPVSKFFEN